MDGKIYDIPFLSRSIDSDFCCADGEIESCSGGIITEESLKIEDSVTLDYIRDYVPEIPPIPQVKFAIADSTLAGWHPSPDVFPSKICECSNPSSENWGKTAASLLSEFYKDCNTQKLFISPFLVIAVWRLRDGRRLSPTAPLLLIPNSSRPIVVSSESPDNEELELKIIAKACKLCWKISLPESLRKWVGKIQSLEIMVSKPMYPFDPKPTMLYQRQKTLDSFSLILDDRNQISEEKPVAVGALTYAWIPSVSANYSDLSPELLDDFFTISMIPISELVSTDNFKPCLLTVSSFSNIFDNQSYRPSYAMLSLKESTGAIEFRGKKIIWGLKMESPAYSEIEYSVGNYSPGLMPRWIFHPNPYATEYQFTDHEGVRRSIPLQRHSTLFGAYYWGGFSLTAENFTETTGFESVNSVYLLPSYIWESEKSDSDVFEDIKLQDLECGEIKAVCRAFRSSGLVATVSPTIYVFSEKGVYLYKESTSGLFSESGLITNYVLDDVDSLEILPTGIRFTAENGTHVSLAGTTVKSSSDRETKNKKIIILANGNTIDIITRPLKLSKAGDFKTINHIFLRGTFVNHEINLIAFGSRDMRHWWKMGARIKGSEIFVHKGKFRFLKIHISGVPISGSTFEGLTIA